MNTKFRIDTARKHIFPSTLVLVAAAMLAFFLAYSCDNSFGVFHEIQIEEQQIGTDLFKNASVKALAADTTNYYAAMAKVLYRDQDAGSLWDVFPVDGSTDYFVNGMVSDGTGTLYVAASSNGMDPTLLGIKSTNNQGTTWSLPLNVTILGDQTVDKLFWAGATLFAATHIETETTQTYNLYHSDGSAAFVDAELADHTLPVLDVVYDGTSWWVLTATKLFSTAALGSMTETLGPSSTKTMRGIAVDATNSVLVTTSDGLLYTYSAGVWGNVTVKTDVELGLLIEVPATATTDRLLIAKHNSTFGYFERDSAVPATYNGNDDESVFGDISYSTTVYGKPVLSLLYTASPNTLLIGLSTQGTDSYALYSNTFDGAVWSGWTAE